MKALKPKHGYAWYKEVSHEYNMVGINQVCPLFAIAAYQNRQTKAWDHFMILKLQLHQGFPTYRKQIKLGSFTDIQSAIAIIDAAIQIVKEDMKPEPRKIELAQPPQENQAILR